MADRMLNFPSRSSSAIQPVLAAQPELLSQANASPAQSAPAPPKPRRKGLFLVKGKHASKAPSPATPAARTWHTREIVAQVEREVAAIAARRNSELLRDLATEPAAPLERDTPWTVFARVVRRFRA